MKSQNCRVVNGLVIHHIGVATNNLDELTDEYLRDGYRITNEVYDPGQKARLRLLSKDNQNSIELIYTDNPESRVFNLSHNNYKKEYHTCFKINNLDRAIKVFKKDGYSLITNIEIAKLFNGRICFMYKSGKLIELMEEI